MLGPKKHSESWQEALRFIQRCPICQHPYKTDEAQLFAKNDRATMVHIACGNCRSFFVAMVIVLGQGLSSVGMVTDLNFSDIKRLHAAEPVGMDEMIGAYEYLHSDAFSAALYGTS